MTDGAEVAGALSAQNRLNAMLDDPECVDNVLLLGTALIGMVDLGREWCGTAKLGRQVHQERIAGGWWAKDVIAKDARTYKPAVPSWGATCEAPMIRRDGYCGSDRGHNYIYVIDFVSGELTPVSYCSRHREWAEDVRRANWAEGPDQTKPWAGAPLAAANYGGVLDRHFPEIDWPELWRRCCHNWVEHPEGEPRPIPRFRLVVGDGDSEGGDGQRPALSLAPAGRRS